MGKHVEPWHSDNTTACAIDCDGCFVTEPERLNRAAACVNALEGLNPEAVRDLVSAIKRARDSYGEDYSKAIDEVMEILEHLEQER